MARRTRNLPVQRPAPQPVRYWERPVPPPARQSLAELEAKKAKDLQLYARWEQRQQALAERDRKFRQFWLGFGAVLALVFLGLVAVAVWWLWTVLAIGALAIPVAILFAIAAAAGGHRCITIVQHMH